MILISGNRTGLSGFLSKIRNSTCCVCEIKIGLISIIRPKPVGIPLFYLKYISYLCGMKKLFLLLLKKYSKTESQRMVIYRELWYQTKSDYREANVFENINNMNIEVLMSNPFFKRRVELGDVKYLKWIKKGLEKSFDESIELTSKK